MSVSQWGILFELVGFLILTVIVQILLDVNIFGISKALLSRVMKISEHNKLQEIINSITSKTKVLTIAQSDNLAFNLFAAIGLAVISLIIVGYIINNHWMFLTSIGIYSFTCISGGFGVAQNFLKGTVFEISTNADSSEGKKTSFWVTISDLYIGIFIMTPFVALLATLFAIIVGPFSLIILVTQGPIWVASRMTALLFKGMEFMINFISARDNLKKSLLLTGTIAALVGLILQFIGSLKG